MTDIPPSLAALLAAWNELDLSGIGAHLERAVSRDVEFVDPNYSIRGRDAFEAMVADFRRKYPRARSIRASAIDRHHDRARYFWRVYIDETTFVDGMDSVAFDPDGLVRRCDGFFGVLKRETPGYAE